MYKRRSSRSEEGFTLIELLVVIAIIAILAVVVVLTLNPAEMLKQSRDSNRVSDVDTLTHALSLYQEDLSAGSLGTASTTYISIPDPMASTTAGDQCQGLGLPTSSLFTWHCAETSTYRNTDGTGWIPLNFSTMSTKSPLGSLPVDPTNTTSSGLFYTYQMQGTKYEFTSDLESQKYQSSEANDGGNYSDLFEKGASLALAPQDYGNQTFGSGNVSQSNMRLSIASNTAFVDFSSAGTLTPYIGDKLTITDSTGHQLVGWIKAAGGGETYGGQLLPNTAFNDTSNVNSFYCVSSLSSVAGGQSGNALQLTPSCANGNAAETVVSSYGAALLSSGYMQKGTETTYESLNIENSSFANLNSAPNLPSSWTQYSFYVTTQSATSYQIYLGATSGKTSLFDTVSVTQVLTPSIKGVTIVSASGGSSYNWTSQDPSFNLDDSSGYTYAITHS